MLKCKQISLLVSDGVCLAFQMGLLDICVNNTNIKEILISFLASILASSHCAKTLTFAEKILQTVHDIQVNSVLIIQPGIGSLLLKILY